MKRRPTRSPASSSPRQRPRRAGSTRRASAFAIPTEPKDVELDFGGRRVRLTNLRKPFWPELGVTKRDLLQYYADVAPVLLPHPTIPSRPD